MEKMEKIVVVWDPFTGNGGRIEKHSGIGLPGTGQSKICFVERRGVDWTPPQNEVGKYVHEILRETKPGERKGVYFVGPGIPLEEYKESLRLEILEQAIKDAEQQLQLLLNGRSLENEFRGVKFSVRLFLKDGRFVLAIKAINFFQENLFPSEELARKIKEASEEEERRRAFVAKVEEFVNALPEPQDEVEVDGKVIKLNWTMSFSDHSQVDSCFKWKSPELNVWGFAPSLYKDCRPYRIGTATRCAYAFVQFHAPHLCGGKRMTPALMAKIGSADYIADKHRLSDDDKKKDKELKKILNLGRSIVQAELKDMGIKLSNFTELEKPARDLAQMVVRRGVVELVLVHYKEHKVCDIKEYKKYAAELAKRILEYLLEDGKTTPPSFDFRIFSKTVKGNPLVAIEVAGEKVIFDRKKKDVFPFGEKWVIKVEHIEKHTHHSGWMVWPEKQKKLPAPEIQVAVIEELNDRFPEGVREKW